MGGQTKGSGLYDIVAAGDCIIHRYLTAKRHSPSVASVLLQVSILNGTDLKTMINYTGEQVSLCRTLRHVLLTLCFLCLFLIC